MKRRLTTHARTRTGTDAIKRVSATTDPTLRLNHPVAFGSEVKTEVLADGTIKASGTLIRFTNLDDPDLCGDFFTSTTYYGEDIEGKKLPIYFHHGVQLKRTVDGEVKLVGPGRRKIGVGTLSFDTEKGILIDAIIDDAKEYHDDLATALADGSLGWSSGAVGHVVARKAHLDESGEWVKAFEIVSWPTGEASLTHMPAEPRNVAESKGFTSIKSVEDITPETGDAVKGALSDFGGYSWEYDWEEYDDNWNLAEEVAGSVYYIIHNRLRQAVENIAGDESMTPDDQATAIRACYDEARDMVVTVVMVVIGLSSDSSDDMSAKAGKS